MIGLTAHKICICCSGQPIRSASAMQLPAAGTGTNESNAKSANWINFLQRAFPQTFNKSHLIWVQLLALFDCKIRSGAAMRVRWKSRKLVNKLIGKWLPFPSSTGRITFSGTNDGKGLENVICYLAIHEYLIWNEIRDSHFMAQTEMWNCVA